MNRKNSIKDILKTVIITAIATTAFVVIGINFYLKSLPVPVKSLIRVANIIENQYMGDYDKKEIEKGVLSAAVSALGDKYSVYYDEESAGQQFLEIDGYYVGIGIEAFANSENGKIEVIAAFEGSPAHKAGIKSGDFIIKVDGKSYDSTSYPEAVYRMRGVEAENPLEEEMTITLERDGKTLDVKLKREKIKLNQVKSEIVDDICYIRYPGFDSVSYGEVRTIVNSLDKSVKGIVIDIRDNPGGEFNSAIDMSDLFLDEATIMYTIDKKGKKEVFTAKDGKCDLPLAILVNGASASASEMFAGALKANKRAVIVGEKTYGKGVSQLIRYINPQDYSKGAVKLTICRNYTPDGIWINEKITPDIEIKAEISKEIKDDAAFQAAAQSIKGK